MKSKIIAYSVFCSNYNVYISTPATFAGNKELIKQLASMQLGLVTLRTQQELANSHRAGITH